ncbi:MAG: ABC transporter permease [Eubacteriales bacterium]|nr:ABC transporter permease [Eubacteriales bacterium]
MKTTPQQHLSQEERRLVGYEAENYVDENYAGHSYAKEVMLTLLSNKGAAIGLVCILIIIAFAIFAPMTSAYTYREVHSEITNLPMRIPGIEQLNILDGTRKGVDLYESKGIKDEYHYFGTDSLGRDIWTRVWVGTRISLLIALLAVLLDVVFGVTYGMISGYFGGKVDFIMQRFVEILTSIPNLIIMMLLLLVLEPGIPTICLALSITGWVNMSRIVRAQVLKIKNEEYVLASRTLGAPALRILFKDILPNALGQIIITFMLSVPSAIFFEAFLAFIGLGVPIPMASLGTLINDGYKSALLYPSQVLLPAAVLSILMLSFNLLGDGLRDAIDPQMRTM